MNGKRLVLDINVLVLGIANVEPASSTLKNAIQENRLLLSSIVVAEFLVKATEIDAQKMLRLARAFPVLTVDLEVARLAADMRKNFLNRQKRALLMDCLIAAQCKLAGAQLVTFNSQDFPENVVDLYSF